MRAGAPYTIKPDTREGHFILLDSNGDPVGAGVARPSKTIPGYVTLVPLGDRGHPVFLPVLRVPADWFEALSKVPVDNVGNGLPWEVGDNGD